MLEKLEPPFNLSVVQPEPLPPKAMLPTMYDLPSEDPEEPGLADEFHDLQPQLLSQTLRLTDYSADRIFTGTDLNLYYDARHPLWHKRPDWFLALDVPRMYEGRDLRNSYVIWQEEVNPFVIVELLSPGTAKQDLGAYAEEEEAEERIETIEPAYGSDLPPSKWTVYEKILQVPHYIVFSRYSDRVRYFKLVNRKYREQPLDATDPRIWIPELGIGLGLWEGNFNQIRRKWLRWYDAQGQWIPSDVERIEQERLRAEQAETRLHQVVLNLLRSGLSIEQVSQLTGLTEAQIRQLEP